MSFVNPGGRSQLSALVWGPGGSEEYKIARHLEHVFYNCIIFGDVW
jgi:hypothetical protein